LNFSNVEIYNEDFKDFLRETLLIRDNSLMYLDPPYYLEKNSKLYGNNGDMHENFDHQSLFNLLKLQKNWIITYNNCDYIKNLYKDYLILDVNWSYSMNKSKTSSEIVIICK
jgi:DNA adenine methylase